MSEEDEKIIDLDAKTWNAKFPGPLAKKMVEMFRELGYLSLSEFIREACRNKVMYHEVRSHKLILDYLVSAGKLDVLDIKEAIYSITKSQL